jgi:hypothetical protein
MERPTLRKGALPKARVKRNVRYCEMDDLLENTRWMRKEIRGQSQTKPFDMVDVLTTSWNFLAKGSKKTF